MVISYSFSFYQRKKSYNGKALGTLFGSFTPKTASSNFPLCMFMLMVSFRDRAFFLLPKSGLASRKQENGILGLLSLGMRKLAASF